MNAYRRRSTDEELTTLVGLAGVQSDLASMKSEHARLGERMGKVEEAVRQLTSREDMMAITFQNHIKSEDHRWEQNERSWKLGMKLVIASVSFSAIAAAEHLDAILKVVLKIAT